MIETMGSWGDVFVVLHHMQAYQKTRSLLTLLFYTPTSTAQQHQQKPATRRNGMSLVLVTTCNNQQYN